MSFKLSNRSVERMAGVDERLKELAYYAIRITKMDFGIPKTGGKRTAEVQKELFDDHKSNCDGYKKKSKHQTGLALDFYAYVNGKPSWDIGHLSQVATAFMQAAIDLDIPIQYGGLWKNFSDYPHIQLKG